MIRVAFLSLVCLPWANSIRIADGDELVKMQSAELALVEDHSEDQTALVEPANYWMAENAALRCKQARRGRFVRRIVGGLVGVLFAVPVAALGALGTSALYWTWYLNGAKDAVLFAAMSGGGVFSAWSSIASLHGGISVGSWTTDLFARLFGADGHKPSCCCWEAESEKPMCGLVGSSIGRRATCPEGSVHDAGKCDMPEPEETFSNTSIGGCECKDSKTCETNKWYRGHAWCVVKSASGCTPQARTWRRQSWDYCRVEATFLPEENITVNEYLSQFVTNSDTKSIFRADPRSVWRFGSWVDTSKALVVAPVALENGTFSQSSCFAGEMEETLDGCAQMCIEEGAVIADERGTGSNVTLPCHAFAYNRVDRLCVRLPVDATGAEFKPYQQNPKYSKKTGWQNFKRVFEE